MCIRDRSGDDEMLKEQYLQLQANPAIFQSYYVGYLEIMKLKELVQDAKGKAFDEVAFHEMLLEIGALPFDCIEERILAKLEAS